MADSPEFRFEAANFTFIADLLRRLAGIHLAAHKREMVYARLARRLRTLGLPDFDAYCALINSDRGADEIGFLVNALTTNLTAFFREAHHFDHLANVALPEVRARVGAGRPQRLRLWSAGCSSGPEAYSIAMTVLANVTDLGRWDARILATDIDTAMVATARRGEYGIDALQTVPPAFRDRFARLLRDPTGQDRLSIAPEVRRLVTFKPLNLLEPWPMSGLFDAIFCRNVLIYFDRAGRSGIADRFAALLVPRGFLYLGHSESLFGLTDRFRQIGQTIYRRSD